MVSQRRPTKIHKAILLGPRGLEGESKQVEDAFSGIAGYGQTLRQPPFNPDHLVRLAEAHPIHSAALEQKTLDTVANGLDLKPKTEDADDEHKAAILTWWGGLFEEFTPLEVTTTMWLDHETIGLGALEVVRDSSGVVQKLFHLPGHTLRVHSDKKRLAQIRNGRVVWFKRWGEEEDFLASSGHRVGRREVGHDKLANEVLVFRKPARRSTFYGIPGYVSAIGQLALAVAARDFNIKFFDNYREPRHLIIVTGMEGDVENTIDEIEKTWQTQLEGQPHHNIFLPIEGDGKVTIHAMGVAMNDMHFARMMEQTDAEILVAHRMPPDRLGIVKRGFLGGSVAHVINQIYKDAVVSRAQGVLEARLDRFVKTEFRKAKSLSIETEIQFDVDFEDLDVADVKLDTEIVLDLLNTNAITLNEGRQRLGMETHEPFGEKTLVEFVSAFAGGSAAFAAVKAGRDVPGYRAERVYDAVMSKLGELADDMSDLREGLNVREQLEPETVTDGDGGE